MESQNVKNPLEGNYWGVFVITALFLLVAINKNTIPDIEVMPLIMVNLAGVIAAYALHYMILKPFLQWRKKKQVMCHLKKYALPESDYLSIFDINWNHHCFDSTNMDMVAYLALGYIDHTFEFAGHVKKYPSLATNRVYGVELRVAVRAYEMILPLQALENEGLPWLTNWSTTMVHEDDVLEFATRVHEYKNTGYKQGQLKLVSSQ